jgi:hypothetical protein
MSNCKFFYCWICSKRRLFSFAYDGDGGNWTGVVCDHSLWSESQHRAEQKALAAKQ